MPGNSKIIITFLDAVTTNQTGSPKLFPDGTRQFQSKITGTGAVSATVTFYGSNESTDTVGVVLDTHTLSGTSSDKAYSSAPITAQWPYIWAVLTSISGTGATVTATGSV